MARQRCGNLPATTGARSGPTTSNFQLEAKRHPGRESLGMAHFGKALRTGRESLRWSRRQLARASGLSEATIKLIETGRQVASNKSILSLTAIAELRLHVAERGSRGLSDTSTLIASRARVPEVSRVFSSGAALIPQTAAYLDDFSAAAYLDCSTTLPKPMGHEVAGILKTYCAKGVALVALGVGDAALACTIAQHLEAQVSLADVSLPLLATASAKLRDAGCAIDIAYQCDLTQPLTVDIRASWMQQSVFLLDCTLEDFDDISWYLRYCLKPITSPGDMLVVRIGTVLSPCGKATWLEGVLSRYCRDGGPVVFDSPTRGADRSTCHAIATIPDSRGGLRRISLYRHVVFRQKRLWRLVAAHGWLFRGAVVGTNSDCAIFQAMG